MEWKWDWKERKEMERLQRILFRYMVRLELDNDKLKGKAGMRAWKYENKVGERCRWGAHMCML